MQFDVLTLFPEMFEVLNESIIGKAREKGLININLVNIRDFSENKHKKVDDTPYGGGAGMVIQPDVVKKAYNSLKAKNAKVIYMSPQGKKLEQSKVEELSKQEHLILLCGHYEGIDQRVIDSIVDEEISIGDYVLTGGEIPAMVLIDSVSRYIDGVLTRRFHRRRKFLKWTFRVSSIYKTRRIWRNESSRGFTIWSSRKYRQMAKKRIYKNNLHKKTRAFRKS